MLIKKYIYRYMTYIPLRFLAIEVLPNPFVCLITVKVEVVATSYAFIWCCQNLKIVKPFQ